MHVSLEYVSVGCNRTPHCVAWHQRGLLAYGADKSVALAEFANDGRGLGKVVAMLHGHSNRVNCVCWVTERLPEVPPFSRETDRPIELLSGSVDKTVNLWRETGGKFVLKQTLVSHTGSVTCLSAVYLGDRTLAASGSSDSSLVVWERQGSAEFVAVQTVSFGRGFALGLDFFLLPGTQEPILACGSDDAKVSLFVRRDEGKFARVQSLSGHEGWVRSVQFAKEDGGDLLLASCSQDCYIRLWRLAREASSTAPVQFVGDSHGKVAAKSSTEVIDEEELKVTGNTFLVRPGLQYSVSLESVLIGHEDWVYSIQWQPPLQATPTATPTQPLCLLSASMDKTMLLWKPDPDSGVWMEQVRVGEVGGNTLGLYGGIFAPWGDLILAHGYQGAFHLWKKEDSSETDLELWRPLPTVSGHFGPVQDLSWEPTAGRFLVSVSADQTSRLHAPWVHPDKGNVGWCEMARPQIHGYDMHCIAMTTSLQYVSGADEKVLRVFEAPQNFVGNIRRISHVELAGEVRGGGGGGGVPLGASLPSLGLSNKAVFTGAASLENKGEAPVTKNSFADHIPAFSGVDLSEPPVEEHLLQNTLWPETQKLYGHGYEIFCVTSSPTGGYVASASKATKQEHAAIRIWDSSSWKQVAMVTHHTLTVTQMQYSHSGGFLLAVSRDRGWSLWQHKEDKDGVSYALVAKTVKSSPSHSRIIWSCAWSHDDRCFATASRDKKVLLWSQVVAMEGAVDCGGGWGLAGPALECPQAATAVDFAPCGARSDTYTLAVGLESGAVNVYCFQTTPPGWSLAAAIDKNLCHSSAVKRLQWRPVLRGEASSEEGEGEGEGGCCLKLASCGLDHAVRVFSVETAASASPAGCV